MPLTTVTTTVSERRGRLDDPPVDHEVVTGNHEHSDGFTLVSLRLHRW